jgi:5-methylthioadenosine/S-adenosylhomocysteine deaminase
MESQIGSLEAGKRADIVVLEMDAIDQVPLSSIYSALVYATKASDVCLVMVDGCVLLRDGQLTTIDESMVSSHGLVLRHQIIDRLQAPV